MTGVELQSLLLVNLLLGPGELASDTLQVLQLQPGGQVIELCQQKLVLYLDNLLLLFTLN